MLLVMYDWLRKNVCVSYGIIVVTKGSWSNPITSQCIYTPPHFLLDPYLMLAFH